MRICRLMVSKKIWPGISTLVLEMVKILKEMLNFLIILMIFLLTITLIGKNLFINQKIKHFDNDIIIEELHRMNFLSFLRSLLSNFMIFFNEDCHIILVNHLKVFNYENIFYFLINIFISTMFLNKFFLALLINKMIESKIMRNLISNQKLSSKILNIIPFFQSLFGRFCKISTKKSILPSFSKNNEILERFRYSVRIFMKNNKAFEKFMFLMCCLSLILVALNDPFQAKESLYNKIIKFLDIPIFIIFIFEIVLLFLAQEKNWFINEEICLRLLISIFYVIYFASDLKVLKLFVALRVFMMINFYEDLKLACKALIFSFWDIFHLLVFFFLFIILFAAIGIKLYKGAFWSCKNIEEKVKTFILTKADCLDFGGDWMNQDFNFDNMLNAINLLFIVSNSSGWLPLMYLFLIL